MREPTKGVDRILVRTDHRDIAGRDTGDPQEMHQRERGDAAADADHIAIEHREVAEVIERPR